MMAKLISSKNKNLFKGQRWTWCTDKRVKLAWKYTLCKCICTRYQNNCVFHTHSCLYEININMSPNSCSCRLWQAAMMALLFYDAIITNLKYNNNKLLSYLIVLTIRIQIKAWPCYITINRQRNKHLSEIQLFKQRICSCKILPIEVYEKKNLMFLCRH